MYYWLTEDLDKYVRIDAISFDGGQTWTDDFQVVIPEDIAADQMKIKAGYRFSTGDPTWEEYIVDYEVEDSRICVLSEKNRLVLSCYAGQTYSGTGRYGAVGCGL